jgi:hypothetical protein
MRRSPSATGGRRTAVWCCLLIGLPLMSLSACHDTHPASSEASAAAPQAAAQGEEEEDASHKAEPEKPDSAPQRNAAFAGKYPLQANPLAGCSLCHVDVEDEFVGTRHFEEKVGCKTCHGPSEAHLADENNEVQPDELFTRDNVDLLCQRCHECGRSEVTNSAVGDDGQPRVCTDCHGHHTIVLTPP